MDWVMEVAEVAEMKMLTQNTSLLVVGAVATIMLLLVVGAEQAFAHGSQVIEFTLPNGEPRTITVVMGHNNEPTAAQETGKHNGKHPMELFISDTRTGLNLADADLNVDKYYYKNDESYNQAAKNGFVPLETDIQVSAVHGDPGHYFARQVISEPGIYGYHVTGTVNYFDVVDVPVDVKAICRDVSEPGIFNHDSWSGGFGCTADVDDDKFPATDDTPERVHLTQYLAWKSMPPNEYMLLFDSTPDTIAAGHFAIKVDCTDDGTALVDVLLGVAPEMQTIQLNQANMVSDLSAPGKMCLYHVDLPAEHDMLLTDIAISNSLDERIRLGATSTATIYVNEWGGSIDSDDHHMEDHP